MPRVLNKRVRKRKEPSVNSTWEINLTNLFFLQLLNLSDMIANFFFVKLFEK